MVITGARAEGMTLRDGYLKNDIPYCDITTNHTETMKTTRTFILARQKGQGPLSQVAASSSDFLNEDMERTAEIFSLFGLFAHVPPHSATSASKSTLGNLSKPLAQSMLSRKDTCMKYMYLYATYLLNFSSQWLLLIISKLTLFKL